MLNEDIVKIATDRINLEIGEQKEWLSREITRIKEEMAGRGLLRSSIIVGRVGDICIEAVKKRTQLIWQILWRFITTRGISYAEGLSEELKALVSLHLANQLADLKDQLNQISQLAEATYLYTTFERKIESTKAAALAKVGTEIDLFVYSLRTKADLQESKSASTVFNIYSPVGSIQIGNNSVARVTQMIDTDNRKWIVKALEEISSKLGDPELRHSFTKRRTERNSQGDQRRTSEGEA
jgi:hypothetical protein